MNSNFRNFAIWIIIGLLLVALFNLFQNPGQRSRANEISYSQFLTEVDNQNVRKVTITDNIVTGEFTDGRLFQTTTLFRSAALAEIGRIAEERGDWNRAIGAYERIISAGGKQEWTAMAEGRIAAIRDAGVTAGG